MSMGIVPDDHLPRLLDLARAPAPTGLSYGTVRDFCEGVDWCPALLEYNRDIKDSQRFWMLKTILATQPRGATLLEIGAGEPIVADILGRLGYRVIVVDPYEGAANGPLHVEHFRRAYTNVEYRVSWFSADLEGISPGSVDCCYSISVIEHIPFDRLEAVVQGMRLLTREGGSTLHAIDYVALGNGTAYHTEMFQRFAGLLGYSIREADAVIARAAADPDTYYLSAEGHNRWRGGVPYDQFPMRRVLSLQVVGWPTTSARSRDDRSELLKAAKLARLRAEYDESLLGPLVETARSVVENQLLPSWTNVWLYNGRMMNISLRDAVGRQIFVDKAYEIQLSLFLTEALKPGDVFLDVGAHHGYFSMIAADLVGATGAVHAFEPTPASFRQLVHNTREFDNVTLHALAIGARLGTATINDYGEAFAAYNSIFAARVIGPVPPVEASHVVTMVSLDDFCRSADIRPTIIKVDVESMEAEVIAGMGDVLRSARPIVVLEVGDFSHLTQAGVPSTPDLIGLMSGFGYRPFDVADGHLRSHLVREAYDYGILVFAPS